MIARTDISIPHAVFDVLHEFEGTEFEAVDVHALLPWYKYTQVSAAMSTLSKRGVVELVRIRGKRCVWRVANLKGKFVWHASVEGKLHFTNRKQTKRGPRAKAAARDPAGLHARLQEVAEKLLDIAMLLEEIGLADATDLELRRELKRRTKE